jgi:hypothetical protein
MSTVRAGLMRWAKVATVAVGALVGAWVDPAQVKSIAPELIATLSIVAGFVAQGLVLLATMFQPGRLSSARIRTVGRELENQQRQAVELFFILGFCIVPLLLLKAEIDVPYLSAGVGLTFLGAVLGVALARLISFFQALAALQRLRHQQFEAEARAEEDERRSRLLDRVAVIPGRPSTSPYGARVPPGPLKPADSSGPSSAKP